MRYALFFAVIASAPTQANASDWEKFYRPLVEANVGVPAASAPQVLPSSGSVEADIGALWTKGFVAIGYTAFDTNNGSTRDGERLAKKLKARYVIISSQMTATSTIQIPIKTPNNTTSYTNGTVNVLGNNGSAQGNYNQTTTTYGSNTTYIPMVSSRYSKMAIFFRELEKQGTGINPRELLPEEVRRFETKRAFVVRFVRDGSPAYMADILPGDVVLKVNDAPADTETWIKAVKGTQPMSVILSRGGTLRQVLVNVPPEWRPQD